ncbi:tlde1 domain-containing protein [Rouxiella sp. Mn2063]|uniref:tlde1 domain-containing protein n=1 Tax=Rouxiella sp. Mn2063 TaxID=3395262 RepID=UPI003BCEAA47
MTWEYSQSTGELKHNGQLFKRGYSGHGSGVNNPEMESVSRQGPIPRGHYRISGAHDTITPVTIILEPILGTNTYGRDQFRIHGGRRDGSQTASEGCIIIDGVNNRQQILNSGDTILVVR